MGPSWVQIPPVLQTPILPSGSEDNGEASSHSPRWGQRRKGVQRCFRHAEHTLIAMATGMIPASRKSDLEPQLP